MDTDIGQRAVVERHQFFQGAPPLPPPDQRIARFDEQIDERHASNSSTKMVQCKNRNSAPHNHLKSRNPAMHIYLCVCVIAALQKHDDEGYT